MNKCEFCYKSKNVDGVFTCSENSSHYCYNAVNLMQAFISKVEPFAKCQYCEYSSYEAKNFTCNMGYDSRCCNEAINLMKEIEGKNNE